MLKVTSGTLNIISHQGNVNQKPNEIPFHTHQVAKIKKTDISSK